MSYDISRLDEKDINRIINSLRLKYGAKLFGSCSELFNPGVNEAKLFPLQLRQVSDSASDTNILFSAAEIGTQKPFKTAMKIWFNWDEFTEPEIKAIYSRACLPRCDSASKERVLKSIMEYPHIINPLYHDRIIQNAYFNSEIQKTLKYKYSSLDYEARMYSFINENIIMKNVSPNFIPLYAANKCNLGTMVDAINTTAPFPGKEGLVEKLKTLKTITSDRLEMKFIITGAGVNSPRLKEFLGTPPPISTAEMAMIIFQIFYIMYVLDAYEISHNDIHLDNIFVQVLSAPQTMRFVINGRDAYLTTRYILKIYDYDHSQQLLLGKSLFNDLYYDLGRSDTFRKGADLSQVLCGLVSYSSKFPDIKVILQAIGFFDTPYILSKTLPSNDERGVRKNLTVHTKEFIPFLMSQIPFAIDSEGDRFYRIKKDELKKYTVEYYFCDLEMNDFKIAENIVFRLSRDGTVSITTRWMCAVTSDYNLDDVRTVFETDKFDTLVSFFRMPPARPDAVYTFERPSPDSLFIPPTDISKIFDAASAIRRSVKRTDESEEETESGFFGRFFSRKVPYRGPFMRGSSPGWTPY